MTIGKVRVALLFLLFTSGLARFASGLAADDQQQLDGGLAASETRRLAAAGIRRIEFRGPGNLGGELRLRAEANTSDVKIEINKHVHNIAAGERATRILGAISLATAVTADLLTIEVKTPASAEWEGSQIGVRADLDILVPTGLVFTGESEFYDFDLSGPLREVRIAGKFGKIRVQGVTEAANLRTEFGVLSLTDARGGAEVNNQYGAITLQQIAVGETPLRVGTQYGAIDASKITGPVEITTDTAPVEITDWTLEKGLSRIEGHAAAIKVQFARWGAPQVTIENENAKVEVMIPKDFSARIRLAVGEEGGGRIRTRGVSVKATRLDRWIIEGIAGRGAGLLEVNSGDYGDILLGGPLTRPRSSGG